MQKVTSPGSGLMRWLDRLQQSLCSGYAVGHWHGQHLFAVCVQDAYFMLFLGNVDTCEEHGSHRPVQKVGREPACLYTSQPSC